MIVKNPIVCLSLIFSMFIFLNLSGCERELVSENKSNDQRINSLELQLAEVADKQAIHDVLNRYARALDWLDLARLDRGFFDDAEIDFGFFKGSGEDFKPVLMQIEIDLGRRWHQTTQASINIKGNTADVESYGLAFGSQDSEAVVGSKLGLYVGYYQDKFEKRDGVWGISYRKYIMLSTVMMDETVLDGDASVFNKVGKASLDNPNYRNVGN